MTRLGSKASLQTLSVGLPLRQVFARYFFLVIQTTGIFTTILKKIQHTFSTFW